VIVVSPSQKHVLESRTHWKWLTRPYNGRISFRKVSTGKISNLVHDQTEPQHPSKLGSTVENMVETYRVGWK
jgi:hypothetical protein